MKKAVINPLVGAVAIAFSLSAVSVQAQSVDLGSGAQASDTASVAIGSGIDNKGSTAGDFGTAVGGSEWGWGPDLTGRMNIAGTYGSAYGFASQAQGRGDTALGAFANTGAGNVDPNDDSTNSYRTAVGYSASATGEASLAIGSFTSATGAGSVAIGFGSVATGDNVVSVGSVGHERVIQNVGAGTMATDAVNYGQLQGVQSSLQSQIAQIAANDAANESAVNNAQTTADNSGTAAQKAQSTANAASTAATAETARAMGSEQTLQANIAQGNAQTLQSANGYTDQRVNALQNSFDSFRQDTFAGIASALAVAGLPQPTAPGRSMVSVAGSTYHGATGFAAGYSRVTQDEKWVMKASITTNNRGDFGATVAAGRQF